MIIWMKAGVDGRPNSQRAKVMSVKMVEAGTPTIKVRALGDRKILHLKPQDICGVEINPALDIKFEMRGYSCRKA